MKNTLEGVPPAIVAQSTSISIIDYISELDFLLPSTTSDVIVHYGLNANSPEAAQIWELSHLTV
jgi:hypothetical protein